MNPKDLDRYQKAALLIEALTCGSPRFLNLGLGATFCVGDCPAGDRVIFLRLDKKPKWDLSRMRKEAQAAADCLGLEAKVTLSVFPTSYQEQKPS